jgi:vitellogenic carboxypeptidase-like protein
MSLTASFVCSSHKVDPENAPFLVWLQGGPGSTSLIGLFNEHGPYYVDSSANLKERVGTAWTRTHSVLYIDNPVGSGKYTYTYVRIVVLGA